MIQIVKHVKTKIIVYRVMQEIIYKDYHVSPVQIIASNVNLEVIALSVRMVTIWMRENAALVHKIVKHV